MANSSKDEAKVVPVVLGEVLEDLERYIEEFGPNHDKVAETWNSLGLIRLHMQRDGHAAVQCHKEALKIYRLDESAASRMKIAVTLSDLGSCYERTQNQVLALAVYQEALALVESSSDEPHNACVVLFIGRAIARLQRR
jgi:tetratricopeptide (TPR) repeat protein